MDEDRERYTTQPFTSAPYVHPFRHPQDVASAFMTSLLGSAAITSIVMVIIAPTHVSGPWKFPDVPAWGLLEASGGPRRPATFK